MRPLLTLHHGARCVRMLRDAEWDEYVCRLYVAGKHQRAADYHTGDRADAEGTAWAMLDPDPQCLQAKAMLLGALQ